LGWEGGLAAETEKTPSHEKSQNNAARTPSRLHALLAGVLNNKSSLVNEVKQDVD
jgi:hypothetical protein